MGTKKILIVSRAFYPIIAPRSFRATELAKEFSRQGHYVTVVTHKRDFDYSSFSETHNIEILDFVHQKWKEIKGNSFIARVMRSLLNYLFLFPDIQIIPMLSKVLQNFKGYDLIISIAVPYPVHWGVALATKKNRIAKVWIADCGDPFMGNKENSRRFPFYFTYVENWFCRQPDFITVPIKEAILAYPASCRAKIRVIPQGFNFSDVKVRHKPNSNPYPIFAYAGLFTPNIRDPRCFLDFLLTRTEKFKFVIYTKNKSLVNPYIDRLGEKLEVHDFIPREQLIVELSNMDFLVNFNNRSTVQSPSKLIDYALTGKPILSINSNDFDPNIVLQFLEGKYINQFFLKDIEQYDIKNVTNTFLTLEGLEH